MKKDKHQEPTMCDFKPVRWIFLACVFSVLLPLTIKSQSLPIGPSLLPGQTATQLPDGRMQVKVHQLVKDMQGNVILDGTVLHIYTIDDGLIKGREIEKL